jgi:hypothetical protein
VKTSSATPRRSFLSNSAGQNALQSRLIRKSQVTGDAAAPAG